MSVNQAWAEKYRPKNINDLIFPNQEVETAVKRWYDQGYIDSNALFYGKPGTGKSSLIKILVNDFIKSPKDVYQLGRKVEDVDNLGRWINSAAVASPCRIVVVEETDRLSAAAFLALKEKFMEKYLQHGVVFLGATNTIYKVDPAVRTRFNIKANFDDLDPQKILNRVVTILRAENVQYNDEDIKNFVIRNSRRGMREILNLLQIASTSGTFNPNAISNLAGVADEDILVQYTAYLIKWFLAAEYQHTNILRYNPKETVYYEQFGKFYDWVVNTINNYADIDYVYVMKNIIDSDEIPLNVKQVIIKYIQDLDFKIYKNMHFIAMLSEVFGVINAMKEKA